MVFNDVKFHIELKVRMVFNYVNFFNYIILTNDVKALKVPLDVGLHLHVKMFHYGMYFTPDVRCLLLCTAT